MSEAESVLCARPTARVMKQLGMEFLAEPLPASLVDAQAFQREAAASFAQEAHVWVLAHLKRHGPTSGEDLTDGLIDANIRPPHGDDRAFGPVYAGLSRAGEIEPYGDGNRRKGNGTRGATIWRITPKGRRALRSRA